MNKIQWISIKESMPDFEIPVLFKIGDTIYSGVRVEKINMNKPDKYFNAFHSIEPGGMFPRFFVDECEAWVYQKDIV